jgi:hypothetical protein
MFFMDWDGDTGLTGLDYLAHQKVVNKKTYTGYDTLQSPGPDTDWNTCDTDGNAGCTGLDLINIIKVVNKKPVTIAAGKPWVLSSTVPLTGNATGTWIPFQNNLQLSTGNGSPGQSILTSIVSGNGELSGRACVPSGTARDELAPSGAQCAIGISITDLTNTPADGLTETGTYGMQLWGAGGDITLLIKVTAWPERDIPETSIRVIVQFPTVPTVDIQECIPNPVDEGASTSCPVIATSGTPTIDTGTDTCGGALNGTGPWTYDFIPNETQGGGACIAAVINGAATDQQIININEVNLTPIISSFAPTTAGEGMFYTYSVTAVDSDIPTQTLSCSKSAGDTCGGTITDTPGPSPHNCAYTFTPGLCSPQSCVVGVRVTDNGTPPFSYDQNSTVTINRAPTWTLAPSFILIANGHNYNQINGVAGDIDNPVQTLTCSKVSQACTENITVSGSGSGSVNCNISFSAGGSAESCNVIIQVTDNGMPSQTLGPITSLSM